LEEETKFTTRNEELATAIEEAETDEELEAVEEEISKLEEEKETLKEKKTKLEGEIEELEGELEELKSKEPTHSEGGKRNMDKNMEIREVINEYVKTKQLRQMVGFKVV